jgi:Uma2 family endonuclease
MSWAHDSRRRTVGRRHLAYNPSETPHGVPLPAPREDEEMAVEPKRYRFTRADYHRMAQTGILPAGARVELIDGEIIEMSPIGRRHKASVDRLTRMLDRNIGDAAIARVQSSIVLGDFGEPEPDLVLLRFRADFYAESDEAPEDVLLVIEVADTSESYDRRTKAPLYAQHGILELWIVDLNRDRITRYVDPTPDGYATTQVFRRGESLSPLAFPHLMLAVDDILG